VNVTSKIDPSCRIGRVSQPALASARVGFLIGGRTFCTGPYRLCQTPAQGGTSFPHTHAAQRRAPPIGATPQDGPWLPRPDNVYFVRGTQTVSMPLASKQSWPPISQRAGPKTARPIPPTLPPVDRGVHWLRAHPCMIPNRQDQSVRSALRTGAGRALSDRATRRCFVVQPGIGPHVFACIGDMSQQGMDRFHTLHWAAHSLRQRCRRSCTCSSGRRLPC